MEIKSVCLCVFVTATVVYLNTLDCGFCFDDLSAIEQNKDLRPTTPWTNLIWDDFWGTPMSKDGSHKSYRPLCVLLFRLNYYIHQLNPMGYHLGNVLLHSVASTLFTMYCYYCVFHALSPAMIAGLLFAVHPVHSEAVAGVVGRAESLSAIFFIASIAAYQKAIVQSKGLGMRWILVSITAGLCAVLSKEQGITFVAVCVVSDVVMNGSRQLRNTIIRGIVLFLFVALFMFARVKIMHAELPVFTVHDNPATGAPTPQRQLTWLYLCYVNIQLLFFPNWLCADWTMGTIPIIESVTDPRNLATVATFLGLFILSFHALLQKSVNNWRIIVMGLSFLVFPFLPASNLFFPVGFVVAERILYVPSMGSCVLISYGMSVIVNNRPKLQTIIGIALVHILVFYSAKTVVRNRDWVSDETLFTSAVRINPNNGKIHNNLGHVYEHQENLVKAEELFQLASQLQSDDVGAFINLGRVRKAQQRYQEAEQAYNEAIKLMPDITKEKSFRIAPNYINVYYNLANLVKLDGNRLEEAIKLYDIALRMKIDFVEVYINKADALLQLNRTEEAKMNYEKAIHYDPNYVDVYYNLGTVSIRLNNAKEAEKYFRHALSLQPTHISSLFNLALLLKDKNELAESEKLLLELVQLTPSDWRALYNLGALYVDTSQYDKAERWFKKTLEVNPSHDKAAYILGAIYSERNDCNTAVSYLSKIPLGNLKAMLMMGDCYTHLRQLDKAKEAYSNVLKYSPKHTMAMHNLAVVMAEQKQYAEAVKLFSAVLQLDPEHRTAKKYLTLAKQQLKKQQK